MTKDYILPWSMGARVLICACIFVHAYMHIFFETISLQCRPSWPGTYYVNLVGLKFTEF